MQATVWRVPEMIKAGFHALDRVIKKCTRYEKKCPSY